jgi:hypothetical protein
MKTFRDIIRAEILSTAVEIRALKRWWRTPLELRPERPATRFALHPSKRRATLLCTIMAHSRGRIHVRGSTLEAQEGELGDALSAMDRMQVQTPLLDAGVRGAARAILAHRQQPQSPSSDACVAPTVERRA